MDRLPEGVVTFLMTDVEGSTPLWEREAEAMPAAMARHDAIVEDAVAGHGGTVVRPRGEGDSRFAVFTHPPDAVAAAAVMQRGLATETWPTTGPIRVRAAVHTGYVDFVRGDYYGSAVNRAARIRALGHGGQTLLSLATYEALKDAPLPDGVSLRDLGEHRLKGLSTPERVFQVDVSGLPDTFPPLASPATTPTNLPEDLTDFVGRDEEMAEVLRLLGRTRLLTILGPGGGGKTRLALEAAREALPDYPQGAFLVELASVTTTEGVVQTIAEAVGMPLDSDDAPLDRLQAYLAPKRMLLVVDNLEHLAGGASVVGDILTAAPGVTVVATSRVKLNLRGETVYPLPPLDTEWDDPGAALEADAVRLFTMAAQRVDPSFQPTADDLEPLRRIVDAVQGLPLGILLAAGWVDVLPVAEIAAEIAGNLDFLESELGDVPERHRSIRAVFDYSWALLDPADQDLFATLSVFRGGFTRTFAEQVAGADLRRLASLVDKSLLVADRERGRFSVHELLRQYGAAALATDPDRERAARDRHAACFADFSNAIDELMRRSDEPKALALAEAELDNVRAAWLHCVATGDGDAAGRLVSLIVMLHEARGWFQAAIDLLAEGAGAFGDHPTEALRKAVQGFFLALLGHTDEAASLVADWERLAQAGGDTVSLMFALETRCHVAMYTGDPERLRSSADRMLEEAEHLGDPWWLAGARAWAASGAIYDGDAARAEALARAALDWCESVGELWIRVFAHTSLAMVAVQEGRIADALEHYRASIDASDRLGYPRGRQLALGWLGEAHEADGDLAAADAAFVAALGVARDLGQVREMLGAMLSVARVRFAMGDTDRAVELLATVRADPAGSQRLEAQTATIHDAAEAMRAEWEPQLPGDAFAAAWRRGSARRAEAASLDLLGAVAAPV
jgi:predicted ATPase/class 3 adenylate cyclase